MPRLQPYLTEYWEGGFRYGSEVWATSKARALDACAQRGLGEKINGKGWITKQEPTSEVLRSRAPLAKKLHSLCFFGLLATASERLQPRELFGDNGILHEWAHWLNWGPATGLRFKSLIRRIEMVEKRIPGYPPRKKGRSRAQA